MGAGGLPETPQLGWARIFVARVQKGVPNTELGVSELRSDTFGGPRNHSNGRPVRKTLPLSCEALHTQRKSCQLTDCLLNNRAVLIAEIRAAT
uniref:Uncharacterized protein n=1 Tax=Angiostrongylus cantonensis TaxID=6313 RepID=A0A0K0D1Y1_ANGCA